MAKLTKKQFEDVFREEVLPYVVERYERDGIPDKPARREAWNDAVDAYMRDRRLPEAAGNWGHPRWLETYRPRSSSRHATKASKAKSAGTYTVHGHMQRRDGRQEAFWTRTGLSKAAAEKLAREQRRESGGVARVIAENGGGSHHATMQSSTGSDWWSAGQRWLLQEAPKEAAAQKRAWIKSGRSPNTFRYSPPEWHNDAVAALGRNDEEGFKAIKLDRIGLPPLKAAKAVKGRHHASIKTPAQLDREIAQAVGPSGGTWKKSDQPFNSEHLDVGSASARVKPTSTYSGADYEWTIWIGPSGRRVLHQSGETRTKAAAKRAAERKLAALRH